MSDEDETYYLSDPPQTRLACPTATVQQSIHPLRRWRTLGADWTVGSMRRECGRERDFQQDPQASAEHRYYLLSAFCIRQYVYS